MRPERISGEAGFEEVAPLTRVARATRSIGYVALFVLILTAFLVAFLRAWGEIWSSVAFIVMGLGIVAAIAFNFEAVADAVISRKTAIGANSVIMVALGFALLAMVNYLSARHYARADLTSARRFTLDDRTRKLLAKLEDDLQIATFMVMPQFGAQADLTVPARDILEQYQVESDRVKVTHASLYAAPREAVRLAEKMGFAQEAIEPNCILMAYKGNTKKLERSDLVEEMPFDPRYRGPRPPPELKLEDAITSAIRVLMEQEERILYALSGHGERPMTHAQGRMGFSLAKAELKGQNYDIQELKLAEKGGVPDDASAVLIAGPRRSFAPAEVEALKKYLDGGGGAVVLVDSTLGVRGMKPCGLADLLEERGIKLRQDVEVKLAVKVLMFHALSETIPAAWYSSTHLITKPLMDAGGLLTEYYRPCLLEKADPEDSALEVEELVKSSAAAWGETSVSGRDSQRLSVDGGGDIKGPTALVIVSGPKEGEEGGKLVVVADSDFACDVMYRKLANGDLFINSINWMVGVKENIGIESRTPDVRSANMTDKNRNRVFWVNIVLVPVLVLACGAVVLWLRRK